MAIVVMLSWSVGVAPRFCNVSWQIWVDAITSTQFVFRQPIIGSLSIICSSDTVQYFNCCLIFACYQLLGNLRIRRWNVWLWNLAPFCWRYLGASCIWKTSSLTPDIEFLVIGDQPVLTWRQLSRYAATKKCLSWSFFLLGKCFLTILQLKLKDIE